MGSAQIEGLWTRAFFYDNYRNEAISPFKGKIKIHLNLGTE